MNRALITGGGGFVGKAIVRQLLKEGVDCAIIGRKRYPELEEIGVKCFQGDVSDHEFIVKCLRGYDAVFHVAALAGIWGGWKQYYNTNVVGTENIITGCKENNIPVLVYTSTPSVVFDREDIINGDETLPYPSKFLCNYAKSKMIAEKIILSIPQEDIATCAIRPHLIWGPEDPHLIPRLLQRGKAGTLKIVGNGLNKVDITYIDNVAHAHILAAKNLFNSKSAAGKSYFISQEKPVILWDWVNELFEKSGIKQIRRKVPLSVALVSGGILEAFYGLLNIENEPKMTRFLAEQLARSHYFSHSMAKRDLGYLPIVTIEEGMDRLLYWLKSI